MNKDVLKNISNIKLSKESYKKIKIMSIDKELSLQQVVQDILEKVLSKKGKVTELEEVS